VDQGGDYENWKTPDTTGLALHLNINKIATWYTFMNTAVRAMDELTATQARVMPGRDTLHMAAVPMSARAARTKG